MSQTVILNKSQLTDAKVVESDMPPLGDGEVRLRIESFAVTANNVTYAVIGDMFGYWNFFPTASEGGGIVPMWGHASVQESKHPDIAVGERVYGYLPMATHLDVLPDKVSAGSFTDAAAHRLPMSPIYNQYSRLARDPEHDPAREDARMLLGPLFKTSFLIEAMMRREGWFGAEQLLMTSASSKTSLALAHCAKVSSPAIRRIGLTSAGNVDFVRGTGLYDEVFAYGEVDMVPVKPSVAVDFAGNASVLRAVHERLADALKYSCLVGATHVDGRGGSGDPLPGPTPTLFFAPDHIAASLKELGPKGFGEAVAQSWHGFVAATDGFMKADHHTGLKAAADAFIATLKGTADPSKGIVVHP